MAMTLRLDDDETAMLRKLAERAGVSQQEAVKRAIRSQAERLGHRDAVAASGQRAVSHYATLLERLSQ